MHFIANVREIVKCLIKKTLFVTATVWINLAIARKKNPYAFGTFIATLNIQKC